MSAKFHFANISRDNISKNSNHVLEKFKAKKQPKTAEIAPISVAVESEEISEYQNISSNNTSTNKLLVLSTIFDKAKHFAKKIVTFLHQSTKELAAILLRGIQFIKPPIVSCAKRMGLFMKQSVDYVKQNKLQRGLAALAIMVVLVGGGIFTFTNFYDIGYRVVAGGKVIGTVKEKSDYYFALSLANTSIANSYGSQYVSSKSVTFDKSVLPKGEFSTKNTLQEKAIATNENLASAYVVNVDGTDLLSASTEEVASNILNSYKERFRPENCTELKFDNKITITKKYAPKDMEKDEASGLQYLVSLSTASAATDVTNTATDASLSSGLDTSQAKAVSLANETKPVLEVVSVQKTSTEKTVPFSSTTVYNANRYEGEDPIVTTAGVLGVNKLESTVTRINDAVVSEIVDQESVVTAPVTEVIEYGSKKRPTGVGTGTFSAPVSGRLTSEYGPRSSGFHTGLDLATSIGTPVKAADDGKVTFAGWKGSYGYLVIINHQNGYVTYYAHNSALKVAAGDIVEKGQVIANVGSTGNSTGPHCHFEIRKGGSTVNPYSYIF